MNNWNDMTYIPNNPMIGTMSQSRAGYNNPYMPAPRYELIKVNGEGGARNFRMAPNSQALLLDETAAIVWHAQTDGTGYLTVTPYDIIPHQQVQPVDINNLAMRVTQLEDIINNAKSNSFSSKQSKKQRQRSNNESANDSTNQGDNESD